MSFILPLTKERIWAKTVPLVWSGCWVWIGGRSVRGYGELISNNKKYLAHRVAYEVFRGGVPDEIYVCHKCDNPWCVNPDHLFLGSQADNLADMARKGRSTSGEKNARAKLTSKQAREIFLASGTQQEIGTKFGISRSNVGLIKRGERWRSNETDT